MEARRTQRTRRQIGRFFVDYFFPLRLDRGIMPFEQMMSKVIKRRKPERGKSDGMGIDGKGEEGVDVSLSKSILHPCFA